MSGLSEAARRDAMVAGLAAACEDFGFFYLVGHGIERDVVEALERESRAFFNLPLKAKMEIAMAKGGTAWRGYFPIGGELTSGRPDIKEGLYLGVDLPPDDPRVQAGLPLHGANLWPSEPSALKTVVDDYMARATRAAALLMRGVSLSLGLEADYFEAAYTADPTVLFRIFNYPAIPEITPELEGGWGVGEHTDYGLLTLLAQDDQGGLQIKIDGSWIDAPPIEGALVCNIGDMLERLTGGRYRSAPHRVKNSGHRDRLSFPLFFDPDFRAPMHPLPQAAAGKDRIEHDNAERWDGSSVHVFEGVYGDYLLAKVGRVFPALRKSIAP